MSKPVIMEVVTDECGWTKSSLTPDGFYLGGYHDNLLGKKPNTRYANITIEIPEGYRLARDEDKRNLRKPKGAMYFDTVAGWSDAFPSGDWHTELLYIIPTASTAYTEAQAELKKVEKAVRKAQDKLKELEGGK